MSDKWCGNHEAVGFVLKYYDDASKLAKEVDVPVENILGLAAQESQYGQGRIASELENYFSMHAPAPMQTGEETALKDKKVRVAKFKSFYQSGQSFVARYGSAIRGKADPVEFGRALVAAGFNSGDSTIGGRSGFAPYLAGIIGAVKHRTACKR
jgi:hypothetical protein